MGTKSSVCGCARVAPPSHSGKARTCFGNSSSPVTEPRKSRMLSWLTIAEPLRSTMTLNRMMNNLRDILFSVGQVMGDKKMFLACHLPLATCHYPLNHTARPDDC